MSGILIENEKCTKCNICSDVCPVNIIEKANSVAFPKISEENEPRCMHCGHCEAFCSQSALILNFNIEEKIYCKPEDLSIEPKNLSLYVKNRRSIRKYSSKKVPTEIISEIIDTCKYGATGGNSQSVSWMVISSTSDIQKITELTIDYMRSIQESTHFFSGYTEPLVNAYKNGIDPICRNAPHLLFTLVPQNPYNDTINGIIALTHFDIIAPSYGIGTCWLGFIMFAIKDSYKPLLDFLNIPKGQIIAYPMIFGYPTYTPKAIPRRNQTKIIWR